MRQFLRELITLPNDGAYRFFAVWEGSTPPRLVGTGRSVSIETIPVIDREEVSPRVFYELLHDEYTVGPVFRERAHQSDTCYQKE